MVEFDSRDQGREFEQSIEPPIDSTSNQVSRIYRRPRLTIWSNCQSDRYLSLSSLQSSTGSTTSDPIMILMDWMIDYLDQIRSPFPRQYLWISNILKEWRIMINAPAKVNSSRGHVFFLKAQGNPRPPRGSVWRVHQRDPHCSQILPDLVRSFVLLALPGRCAVNDLLQHLLLGQPCPLQCLLSQLYQSLKGKLKVNHISHKRI